MTRIDAADYSVLSQTLQAVAAEMGDILQLSAHSSVVRETRDCATVLSDRDGHAVAQAEMNAIHVNSVQSVFDWARERLDFDSLRPGEALVTNHPYQNGQHLNDIFVLLPVFHDGQRVGFASSVCHHIDIGGAIAGANAAATDYQQEGFVIPLMRVDLQRDLLGGTVEQLLAANIRMPGVVIGDFRAQISAVLRGQMLLERLFARHGIALLAGCMQDMLDASEAQMRAVLQAMPDGTHEAVDLMDGPRVGAPTIPIRVQLHIEGDTACVDLRDNDDAVRWPVNATRASTHAAVMTMFACQLPPGTPINAGMFRPIRILTRPGSILDPLPPSPVRGRMAPVSRVASALKKALAAAGAPRVSAGGGDATNFITWTWQAPDGGYRMYAEGVAGGYGAGDTGDGESGLCQSLVNVLNTPVEAIERDHDFVRILEYTLIPDSGGAGRQRGGLAVRRRYEVLRDGVKLSTTGDRHGSRPWGLHGGHPGTSASYTIVRDGVHRQIPAAATEDLQRGDFFIAEAPGGGGWGDPRERCREHVAQDLADGRITAGAARDVYGMSESEIAAAIAATIAATITAGLDSPTTPHRSPPR